MDIRAVIVDDDPANRKLNRELLEEYFPEVQVVAEADSVDTAVDVLRKHNPDLLLLDIEIKGGSGFQVLQQLKPYRFKVVFITAFDHFAIRAFKFSAVDYILKPVNETEFQQAIQNALQSLMVYSDYQKQNEYLLDYYKKETQQGKIVLRTSDALHVVDFSEIIYCRSDNTYTTFYLLSGEEIVVSKSLKEYVSLLEEYGFFRPHQSYLVNMNYVKKVDKTDGGFVVMKNGKEIPVSLRQKKKIIELLEKL
ncbi:LytTR family DNA-binding domain-containing protein [Candidatus Sulfidibacterium hydrothermale]|uniref:LytR/AlgR family response regulator transcription factor n=1 Tax=Candidatus Sulfidibacterium hydrothermale TaxID=2875962 RepID=UPI001F0A7F47|nr:LytTR family DNA-binding domain-containing protein [Candidatus Sulfidibacterium hydrothermale]UBM62997.1 LytTR family DNA-binding domain-containing protein [Candidatus Sulfidibacterium hydrothermale]